MSLARAFSKRTRERFGGSLRNKTAEPIQRSQISLPVALISSTNAQLYNAIDIADMQAAMASDASSTSSTRTSSDGMSVDACSTPATSVECSPTHESTNPLAYYFSDSPTPSCVAEPPAIPKRALSHSKREHVRLARARSVRSSTQSLSSTSSDLTVDAVHPFSHELEQLNEIAEEFGLVTSNVVYDEDTAIMQSKGLVKCSVEEYMAEIEDLMAGVFEEGDFSGWI